MKRLTVALCLVLVAGSGSAQDSPEEKGVAFLKAQQSQDGSWGGRVIDTAEALETIALAPNAAEEVTKARAYLKARTGSGTDFLARKGDLTALLAHQNADGSWGAALGHEGTALDTALAVRAVGTSDLSAVTRASEFLDSIREPNGRWDDVFTTAMAVATLGRFALDTGLSTPDLMDNLVKGTAYLLTQQNGGGSFGEPAATAWAVMALLRTSQPAGLAQAKSSLLAAQQANGSWENSPHVTALAVRALFEKDPAPADLVIDSIAFSPTSPAAGEIVFVSVTTKNQGSRTAKNVDVQVLGSTFTISEIPAGGTAQVALISTFAAGTQTVTATADPANRVIESNDANNSGSATLVVSPGTLPDLSISALTANPSSPLAGQVFTVTAQIAGTAKNIPISFFVDGIKVGGDASTSVQLSLPAGAHTITAVVDPKNVIAETNESNNTAALPVTVLPGNGPLPDLTASIAVSKDAPAAGESVTVSAQIVNVGPTYSHPGVVARLFDGPTQIGTDFVLPSLATGSVATIQVSASFVSGVHRLTVVADAANVLAEASEANNVGERFLTVGSGDLADLVITFVGVSDPSLDNGEPVTLSAKVKNVGLKTAGGFVVRFLDEGRRVGDFAVSSLAPGQETLAQLGWIPPVGTHRVFAEADATHRVAESNEGNNLAMGPSLSVSTTPFVDAAVFTEEGTEFWVAVPPVTDSTFLVLTSEAAANFTLSGGMSQTGSVAPGAPVIVPIPDAAKVTSIPPSVDAKGILVAADRPVRAFLVIGTFGLTETREATLVLPKPTLSTDYRVPSFGGANFEIGESGILVVGTAADTAIALQAAGQTFNVGLQPGEVFRFPAAIDLTGSRVTSSKPVAVFTYTTASRTNQPSIFGATMPNPILEQAFPSDFYGTRHFVGTQINRAVYYLARVVAHEDGTQVVAKRNGAADQTFALNAGEFADVNAESGLEIVTSNPALVVRYFNRGDAATLAHVLPVAGYKERYRFHRLGDSSLHASYGTIVAPFAETSVTVNGVAAPFPNSFEVLRDDVGWANDILYSPFEQGTSGGPEFVVEASRPVQIHVYGGLFAGRHSYVAGYRFQKKPDLVVSSLSAPEAFTGAAVNVTVRVTNFSFADASDVLVLLYDGDVLVGEATISSLPRESEAVATISWTPGIPGDRPLTAVLDPANTVIEGREDNNAFAKTVKVRATIHLDGSLALSGSTFLGNQDVGIDTLISNLSSNVQLGNLSGGQLIVEVQDANGNVVSTLPTVSMTELLAAPEGLGSWHFFAEASITPASTKRGTAILATNANFTELVESQGQKGTLDLASIRVFELVGPSFVERSSVFVPAADFNLSRLAKGRVEWIVPGLVQGVERKFRIYFDVVENGAKTDIPRILEPAYANDGFDIIFGFPPAQIETTLVLSDRKGGFSTQTVPNDAYLFFSPRSIQGAALADLNGDRYYDVARFGPGEVAVNRPAYLLRSGGANGFVSERPYLLGLIGSFTSGNARTADLDGDGRQDLVVYGGQQDRPQPGNAGFESVFLVQVFHGADGGRARHRQELVALTPSQIGNFVASSNTSIGLADFNGDGWIDLVVSTEFFSDPVELRVFLGTGLGTFATTPILTSLGAFTAHKEFACGDFDGDGKSDLAFPPLPAALGAFVKGNGDGTFQPASPFPSASMPFLGAFPKIGVLDYDRDGKLDLLYPGTSFDVVVVFGDGTGKFGNAKSLPVNFSPITFSGLEHHQAAATLGAAKKTSAFLKDFAFNTNGFLAGNYTVVVKVVNSAGQILFTASEGFEILAVTPGGSPAAAAKVQPDKATYAAGESAILTSTAFNTSPNVTLTDLTLKLQVLGTTFTAEKTVASLAPGASSGFAPAMPIGTLSPGTYTAKIEVVKAGVVIASDQSTFSVAPTTALAGSIALSPGQVSPGGAFTIEYSLTNLGNLAASGTAEFLIVNPTSQAVVGTFTTSVSVAPGQTATGTVAATAAGLAPGTYLVVFKLGTSGIAQALLKVVSTDCAFLAFAIFGDQLAKLGGQGAVTGDAFSNVKVELMGKAKVNGNAKSAGTVTVGANAKVTGTITQNAPAIVLPPADPLVNFVSINNSNGSIGFTAKGKNPLSNGEFTLAANDSITLAQGFYFFTKFTVNGTLTVTGPVVIAVAGEVSIQNESVVNGTGDASTLLVVSKTASAVKISGKSKFRGLVYAPKAPVSAAGQCEVKGSLVGKTVTVDGDAKVIYEAAVTALCPLLSP